MTYVCTHTYTNTHMTSTRAAYPLAYYLFAEAHRRLRSLPKILQPWLWWSGSAERNEELTDVCWASAITALVLQARRLQGTDNRPKRCRCRKCCQGEGPEPLNHETKERGEPSFDYHEFPTTATMAEGAGRMSLETFPFSVHFWESNFMPNQDGDHDDGGDADNLKR